MPPASQLAPSSCDAVPDPAVSSAISVGAMSVEATGHGADALLALGSGRRGSIQVDPGQVASVKSAVGDSHGAGGDVKMDIDQKGGAGGRDDEGGGHHVDTCEYHVKLRSDGGAEWCQVVSRRAAQVIGLEKGDAGCGAGMKKQQEEEVVQFEAKVEAECGLFSHLRTLQRDKRVVLTLRGGVLLVDAPVVDSLSEPEIQQECEANGRIARAIREVFSVFLPHVLDVAGQGVGMGVGKEGEEKEEEGEEETGGGGGGGGGGQEERGGGGGIDVVSLYRAVAHRQDFQGQNLQHNVEPDGVIPGLKPTLRLEYIPLAANCMPYFPLHFGLFSAHQSIKTRFVAPLNAMPRGMSKFNLDRLMFLH